MVTTASNTLPRNYTTMRPIRAMTATAREALTLEELAWIDREWRRFMGGPEDQEFNVIMERVTPQTAIRIWIVDRDGPDGLVMLMLPEDY